MALANHLFASDSGELFDTRAAEWSKGAPLRPIYRRTYSSISTPQEFKATLRAGGFAWPGGYPLHFICDDGESLCFKCGKAELKQIIPAIRDKERGGWRVVACDINYEDTESYCSHCNERIESAYGEDS